MLISFENANSEIFNIQGNYILTPNWSGFGDMPVITQLSKAPYQDGETFIDTLYDKRILTVEFAITGSTRQQVFNRRLLVNRYFNPKLGLGKLIWQQEDGTIYHIDCIVSDLKFPDGEGQSQSHQMVIIQFIAPNPFWYDPNILTSYLVGFAGGLSFPFSFPINFGTVGTQITINNAGNVDTPILITFSGEITDPVITNNTTGESLTIVKTINDGDTLIINTAFGSKSVRILSGGVYSNAFEYVDPDSKFWQLVPGENDISYSATSEGANAKGQLQYYQRYSGV